MMAHSGSPPVAKQDATLQTLAALRSAHRALRKSRSNVALLDGEAKFDGNIHAFLHQARELGAHLSDSRERQAAQGILDFWSAELAASARSTAKEFAPILLAPFKSTRLIEDKPLSHADKSEQRALVRIAAFAREWQDSGRESGYLLTTIASISHAAKFRDLDTGIAELVSASETAIAAERQKLTKRLIVRASILVFVPGLLLGGMVIAYLHGVYLQHQGAVSLKIPESSTTQTRTLKQLSFLQPLMPPYELSGTTLLRSVTIPGLWLNAPNFADVSFMDVSFPNAHLANASFTQGEFSVSGVGKENDFRGADLRQTQFRGTRINDTSFAAADLYRAVFDRARLCDVDFTGANLRSASFWGASLDKTTKVSLSDTAWWLAVGWQWKDIRDFARADRVDDRKVDRLKGSNGFRTDLRRASDGLRTATRPIERATALIDIAWTRAIWGVDVGLTAEQPSTTLQGPRPQPCNDTGDPVSARDAAERAICIITKLNADGDQKGTLDEFLARLRDTLAYILMQGGQVKEASLIFAQIQSEYPKLFEEREVLFRSAIARYVSAGLYEIESSTVERMLRMALNDFNRAVNIQGYLPTHELRTLRSYVFSFPFEEDLRRSNNIRWPFVPDTSSCRISLPAETQSRLE